MVCLIFELILDNSSSKNKKKKSSTERYTRIVLSIALLIVIFGPFLTLKIIYGNYLIGMSTLTQYYSSVSLMFTNIIYLHNILREYLINKDSVFRNSQSGTMVDIMLGKIYTDIESAKLNRTLYSGYLPENFNTIEASIRTSDLCYLSQDSFSGYLASINITCENFMSNSTAFGLDVFMSNYIEAIEETLYKFRNFYSSSKDPFQVFNDPSMRSVNIATIYFIFKAYDLMLNTFENSVYNKLNEFDSVYYIVFAVILTLSVLVFMLYVRSSVDKLDKTVLIWLIFRFTKPRICFLSYLKRSYPPLRTYKNCWT